ncbi:MULTISPECIES: hypothetical protein [Acetobacter]|jgi:hypothetical protein|nr:hypothetical protein [Acetobacter lovaniensis]MCI1698568.1 hypothetical protein [Acetobacter lovaniensis]MCP1239834.1 hypothetical protein [Acetobacter lovaniensis]NHN82286.1 hypothetical protein [Acetobacter lovaniensis]GBQ73008.1 hypothetical protein AA0474_2843 [Acetobacter lovaniensis NRIC 0474]
MKRLKNMVFIRKASTVLGAVALLLAGAAQAQSVAPVGGSRPQAPSLTPEQVATMQHDMDTALHYKLAPDVLPRLSAALRAIQAAKIQPPGHAGMSLDQQIALVGQVPGLDAILKAHGLDARSFVMSLTCVGLTGSLLNIPPGQGGAHMPVPDAANVAVLKNNPQALQELVGVLREGSPASSTQVH